MTRKLSKAAALEALKFQAEMGVEGPVVEDPSTRPAIVVTENTSLIGTSATKAEAARLANAANTLEELEEAIKNFDGLAIRKTAINTVFADGNPKASIMVIGEAPGADEDEQGKPFVGASGQLLDKIFSYVGLSRRNENPADALYISNIVNWRPPGNRTPTPAEMEVSLPFIERHITLIKPKIIVLVGNTPTKSLLNSKEGIMKLRGRFHDYVPASEENQQALGKHKIIALPTFHPAFLLRNPNHKKTVWFDVIELQKKREELGITKA